MKRLRLNLLLAVLAASLGVWLWLLWLERSYREAPYSLIEEGLYVGRYVSEPPPGTEAVVNLCESEDSYQVGVCLWEPIRTHRPHRVSSGCSEWSSSSIPNAKRAGRSMSTATTA